MQSRNLTTTGQKIQVLFDAMAPVAGQPSEAPRDERERNVSPMPTQQSPRQAHQEGEQQLQGLYIISVAARILSMHPQTLRKYERVGLVRPSRTVGMLRLYSEEDIAKLRMIKDLVDELRLN
jgi:hypothetical protein